MLLLVSAVAAPWIVPSGYAQQFRDSPSEPPSRRFPLGTDELGRDLLARTLYGTRISLMLAGAAAGVCILAGAAAGVAAGWAGGLRIGLCRAVPCCCSRCPGFFEFWWCVRPFP